MFTIKKKAKSTLKHYKIYIFLANLKTLVLDSLMHLSKDKCKHMETLVLDLLKRP